MTLPKMNMCMTDRIVRGVLSIALIIFTVFWAEKIGDILLQTLIIIFAVLNLISFSIGWCPVYKLANLSTYKG